MNDISPILLESVQGYFDMWFYADKEVKEIYKKVQKGTATFKEMKRFSERAGAILVESLKVTFSADKLPDGKLYQNIAEKVIIPMLEDNHVLITEVCEYVSDDLNKAAKIGVKTVTAKFNADKAETVAQIAANCGGVVPGNKAAQLVENATMSMVDDFIQANIEFQKKLGLVPQIQRIYHKGKKHCEFCASLQYTGEYKGPGMPAEIFRRHRDCRCTLIYKPQKGPYKDPWSKAEKDDYQKLVADQRKYLTELDKMSASERRLERNAKARAKRRSQYSPSEWADRKAQQRIIAENRAAGKEYRAITQEKILKEKNIAKEIKNSDINNLKNVEKSRDRTLFKLKDTNKNGIINIKIDEFTPCLRKTSDGQLVDTVVEKINDKKLLKKFNKENGWYINWEDVPTDCQVCALKVKGSDTVEGLVAYRIDNKNYAVNGHWIVSAPQNRGVDKVYSGVGGHLFAIMAEESVEAGYGGFIFGKAASKKLRDYYIDKFGGKSIDEFRFYIDEKAAQKLLEIYDYEWKE